MKFKFKYGDKIKVKSGFFKGKTGTITGTFKFFIFEREYYVEFNRYSSENTFIKQRHLELIK